MTDTSLPSAQPPSATSYVDSYNPPTGSSTSAAPSATKPQTAAPSAPSAKASSDPLADLEKALQDYEDRQKQLAGKTQTVVDKTQQAVKTDDVKDPLAELERVLDEYESRYKQTAGTSQDKKAPAKAPEPVTPEELQSVMKDEPMKPAATNSQKPVSDGAESIEEQNIFELLGVGDAEPAEKEAFLDELQQALWEDFLDRDVSLLVTPDQMKEIEALRQQNAGSEIAVQEQLIKKVETLVPDVEEIMLEKALELKEDMVRERVAGMKEYYAARPDDLAKVQEAEKHISAGRWKTGTQLLNTLNS